MSNSNKIYSIVALFAVTFVFVAKETDAFLLTQHGTNPLTDKSVFGHFTWGGEVSGAYIMDIGNNKIKQKNGEAGDITMDYNYSNTNGVITQIVLYLDADESSKSSAEIVTGGIGSSAVSLKITSQNATYLRYMVIVFGVKN